MGVLLLALLTATPSFEGPVVAVKDGDTLAVLVDRREVTVRLAEIDTPEKAQPYGMQAKKELSALVFGKSVRVVSQATDRYGRTVGRVFVGPVDVCAEMVRRGAAWVYRQYSKDASLLRLEDEARAAGRGLWALPESERTPPWAWRREKRSGGGTTPSRRPPSACGAKRHCSEMQSCEEARFYLRQCGVQSLDRDGDGVPCETLCR